MHELVKQWFRVNLTGEERVLSYLPLAHIVERPGMQGTAAISRYHVSSPRASTRSSPTWRAPSPTIFLSVPRLLLKFQQGVFARMPGAPLERLLRIPILNRSVKKRVLRKLA